MLHVLFRAGGQRYAVLAGQVREIAPLVATRPVPHAPDYVAGICNYRGESAPVLDLARLLGGAPAKPALSTRIIFVDYPAGDGRTRPLGLIAEGVTRAVDLDDPAPASAGVVPPEAPYLGGMIVDARPDESGPAMIQRVEIAELLPGAVRDMLFSGGDGHDA